MLKKMMAKLGKGSAKADLVLYQTEVPLGGQIRGELVLQGGTVEQTINKVKVELYFELKSKEKSFTHLIAVIPYQAAFIIQPGQERVVPFELALPEDLLISNPTASYYLTTTLDIQGGIDSSDRDEILVTPSFDLMQVMIALEQLGFQEHESSRAFNGVTQEFIFSPTTFLLNKLEWLTFIVALEPTQIRLLANLEIYSFFGEKNKQQEIVLSMHLLQNLGQLKSYLQHILKELVEGKERYEPPKKSFVGAMGRLVTDFNSEFDRRKK
jgi:sporulation-control protein